MKKILIVNNNMYIGGVQKALVNLLWNIHGDYDISLLLFHRGGECLEDLPPDVKIIAPCRLWSYLGMAGKDAKSPVDKLCRSFFAAVSRVFGRKYSIAIMSLFQKKIRGYDAAISYLHNAGDKLFYGGCNDFVLRHVDAPKKITVLHCDYLNSGANTPANSRQYAGFDTIAACSEGCARAFLQANPGLESKLRVVHNCHRFDKILEAAEREPQKLSEDKINIVTVARFGKEKGVTRAIEAVAKLGEDKNKIQLYLVGDGAERSAIETRIRENELSRCVTLCGMRENPYGFIKAADLLLIPSVSEAAPLVIGEAACLGTPVLSTETSSAGEMIEHSGIGWVCENSVEAMTRALEDIIQNPDKLKIKKEELSLRSFDNQAAKSEFAALF